MPPRNKGTLGEFAAGLLDRDAPSPSRLTRPDGSSLIDGYAVHRNGVATGLIGALRAIYPTLERLIGAENFSSLAHLHVTGHPPASPVLHDYGHHLATHIATLEQLVHLPFLADVARVERAWLDAWHAADAPPLSASSLAGLDPATLMEVRLPPHPAARLLQLASSAASLVRIDRAGGDLTGFDPAPPEWALITRPDVTVHIEVLTEAHAAFLAELLSGRTLSDAAEAGLTADATMDLPAAMALMIASGALQEPGNGS